MENFGKTSFLNSYSVLCINCIIHFRFFCNFCNFGIFGCLGGEIVPDAFMCHKQKCHSHMFREKNNFTTPCFFTTLNNCQKMYFGFPGPLQNAFETIKSCVKKYARRGYINIKCWKEPKRPQNTQNTKTLSNIWKTLETFGKSFFLFFKLLFCIMYKLYNSFLFFLEIL